MLKEIEVGGRESTYKILSRFSDGLRDKIQAKKKKEKGGGCLESRHFTSKMDER